ncbi:universal stress protein [Marmoricola sp. RAF53]|uniref:universal stress protein n=1 Tax=Marmoricola sp. RAF53 TaxID=3233059 RepID=UPI003F9B328F
MTTISDPIVVGYDGSPDAGDALLWALDTAASTGHPVRVVIASTADERLPRRIVEHEQQLAHSAAVAARDLVRSRTGVPSVVIVERGWPLAVLAREGLEAAMVVVGSRGYGRLEGYWLGSVSQHLAAQAECPVAVVRAADDRRSEHILVGVDGSDASRRALAYAAERAERTGEAVLAVHAYQYPGLSCGGALGGAIGALPTDLDTEVADAAQRLAAELVAGVVVDHPDVVLRSTAVAGHPGRVLARLSEDASLVVVGSRGRTPVQEILLGSVSQETLRRACCPVLVVR